MPRIKDLTVPVIHEFTTVLNLMSDLNVTPEDALVVPDVPSDLIDGLLSNAELRRRGSRYYHFKYFNETRKLVITIPTPLHESLHSLLFNLVRLRSSLLEDFSSRRWENSLVWDLREQGRFRQCNTQGLYAGRDGSLGEGDSLGGPSSADQWPTLAIEASCSQSLESLREVVNWWFAASDHQVKVVILVELDVRRHVVFIEKYTEATTGESATLVPHCDSRIRIHLTYRDQPWCPPLDHVVCGDTPLRIEFRHLHLRPPQHSTEKDVVLDVSDLRKFGNRVFVELLRQLY